MNKDKSEALWLGLSKDRSDKPLGVRWPNVIKILGIKIGYDLERSLCDTFRERIRIMKVKLNMWLKRNLSLSGKVLILKTFGISQILHVSSVYVMPDWALKDIKEAMFKFLWGGGQYKVKNKVA